MTRVNAQQAGTPPSAEESGERTTGLQDLPMELIDSHIAATFKGNRKKQRLALAVALGPSYGLNFQMPHVQSARLASAAQRTATLQDLRTFIGSSASMQEGKPANLQSMGHATRHEPLLALMSRISVLPEHQRAAAFDAIYDAVVETSPRDGKLINALAERIDALPANARAHALSKCLSSIAKMPAAERLVPLVAVIEKLPSLDDAGLCFSACCDAALALLLDTERRRGMLELLTRFPALQLPGRLESFFDLLKIIERVNRPDQAELLHKIMDANVLATVGKEQQLSAFQALCPIIQNLPLDGASALLSSILRAIAQLSDQVPMNEFDVYRRAVRQLPLAHRAQPLAKLMELLGKAMGPEIAPEALHRSLADIGQLDTHSRREPAEALLVSVLSLEGIGEIESFDACSRIMDLLPREDHAALQALMDAAFT